MSRLRAFPAPLALAALLVAPAEATTSYYQGASSEAAFNSAIAGLTLMNPSLTFSAADLGSGGLFNASGTGIDFLGFDDLNNPTNFTVNSGSLTATQAAERLKIVFPAGAIYAFGLHLTVASGSANWCIELSQNTCDFLVSNSSPSNVQFFGFVSTTPVTAPLYIRPSGFSPTMVLPNFEAFTASQTPEPHTMLLVGLGLIIVPLLSLRLRQKA